MAKHNVKVNSMNDNERSEAIELIKIMDAVAKRNTWEIKTVGGEKTLNTGDKRMFPDVILYGDNARTRVLQGWEIKMPDVPITDEAFIADAQRKADFFSVNSCITWNFTYGKLYIKTGDEWRVEKVWELSQIKVRQDVNAYRADWEKLIEEILIVINDFFVRGKLLSSGIGEITEGIYKEIIEKNKAPVAEKLNTESSSNKLVSASISEWWDRVKKEYAFDEQDMYSAYAKCVLLNWLNKFTFANLIKSYHNPAMRVESINADMPPKEATKTFAEITEKCDFYNVFASWDYSEFLPAQTWIDLTDYNSFLIENMVSDLPQETLQAVLEHSIQQFKRNTMGLFATPTKLARVLVMAGITDLTADTIDPCCGTGTIVKEILEAKATGTGIENAYKTTYASDKFSFPLQVSNIAMTNPKAMNLPSLLFQKNAFELEPNDRITITNPQNGELIEYELPLWGNIVSNLPFVAFDQDGREEDEFIPKIIKAVKADTKIKLSRKGDLYQSLLLSFWKKLKNDAKVSVITSNSWLGTVAGTAFFKALSMYYNVDCIVVSGCGKWFDNADVITVMIFLTKKDKIALPDNDKEIYFGLTVKRISDWTDDDIEKMSRAILLKKSSANIIRFRKYRYSEISAYEAMNISLNSLFYNVDWLSKLKSKLCPITDYFEVFRGMKTAQDEIFYLKTGEEVDKEYIGAVFKSAKNTSTLIAAADTKAFVCDKSEDELRQLGHTRTLKWIEKYKGHLNKSLPNKEEFWRNIADNVFSGSYNVRLFTGMNPEQRIFYGLLDEPSMINQRAIGFLPNEDVNLELCHALLNSIIGVFYTEAIGFPKGLGALDNCAQNIKKMYILDFKSISEVQIQSILLAFKPLLERKIKTTIDEYQQPDRLAFEKVVAECFGYEKYLDEIVNCVIEMQHVRLSVKRKSSRRLK